MNQSLSMSELLSSAQIVLVAGAGGVGKTTTAAALATYAAADLGRKTLVITVDPARRLASSLGIGELGSEPREVDLGELGSTKGRLYASMIDMKASWDEMIERCSPDTATAAKILANPIYSSVSSRFVQSHDYIAVESLFELYSRHTFDLIVVDTPPSRSAIDFLEAPKRMEEFFSSRLLRWLTVPRRSRLFSSAFKPFYTIAEKILGSGFLEDISEFFLDFQRLHESFVTRARSVTQLLRDPQSYFVVVTTAEEGPTSEALFFAGELQRRQMRLGAILINRALPNSIFSQASSGLAHSIADSPEAVVAPVLHVVQKDNLIQDRGDAPLATLASEEQVLGRVLVEMANCYQGLQSIKEMEAIQQGRLAAHEEIVHLAPYLEGDVTTISKLYTLGSSLLQDSDPLR